MSVFEQAMQMEKEGEALYRRLASEVSEPGMKRIFQWLADQEIRHYEIFKGMRDGGSAAPADPVRLDIKSIFSVWQKERPRTGPGDSQVELYRKALEAEKNSILLYEKEIAAETIPARKNAVAAIIAEEKNHQFVLENIIEFVTKPDFWAENAEFSHTEKDYYL